MKKKFYVLGDNAKKSLSPTIFNYWFKKFNIKATYEHKEIKRDSFHTEIIKILNEKDLCGFNVTIPFKEVIREFVTSHEVSAKEIGATNCVTKINNKWVSINTDWIGFEKSLSMSKKLERNKASVFGFGGAAKAIIYSLKKKGFKEIKIFNRTYDKIKDLNWGEEVIKLSFDSVEKNIQDADLIVNTIPANILKGKKLTKLKQNLVVCDIVYTPKETDFLNMFKHNEKIYGIYMLIYQAAPCFKRWFGVEPEIDGGLISALENKIK